MMIRAGYRRLARLRGPFVFLLAATFASAGAGCFPRDPLPRPPDPVDPETKARIVDLDEPISGWSDELVLAVLDGTSVAPGAETSGDTSPLAGLWTAKLKDQASGNVEQIQIVFDDQGAVTELRLFAEGLTEAVVLRLQEDPAAKLTAVGRLLGTLTSTDGIVFDITIVAALDITIDDVVVTRTRDAFQFVVSFGPDGDLLLGSVRHTREVLASNVPAFSDVTIRLVGTATLTREAP